MTVYRFADDGIINELTIKHTDGGGTRAYAKARDGASEFDINKVKDVLNLAKMSWVPMVVDGKPVLEIRNFRGQDHRLVDILTTVHAASELQKRESSHNEKVGFIQKLKNRTLQASGALYLFGDSNFLIYGIKEAAGKHNLAEKIISIASGVFYAAGTPFILFFGQGDKSDFQVKDTSYNVMRHLEKKGFSIHKDSAMAAITHGHSASTWSKFKNFSNRYPAEIANSMFALGGAGVLATAFMELRSLGKNPFKKSETLKAGGSAHNPYALLMDIGLGSLTIMAGLISVFVQEEVRDPDQPRKKGIEGIKEWIKEKPLRLAGGALGAATIFHGISTAKDYLEANRKLKTDLSELDRAKYSAVKGSLPNRALFVATSLSAEVMMAVSSKGHGVGVKTDSSLDESVYSVMADLICHSPENTRDKLITEIATALSDRKNLGGTVEDITKSLHEHIDALNTNPWIGKAPKAAPTEIMAEVQPEKPVNPVYWQQQTSASRMNTTATSVA